jgi:hypothetical protein
MFLNSLKTHYSTWTNVVLLVFFLCFYNTIPTECKKFKSRHITYRFAVQLQLLLKTTDGKQQPKSVTKFSNKHFLESTDIK